MLETNDSIHVLETYFAPAHRDDAEEMARQSAMVRGVPMLGETLNALPGMLMIINGSRQIVAVNTSFLRTLNLGVDKALGKRPGELLDCVHADEGPSGCGTSPHCATCGAVRTILESQALERQVAGDCRILVKNGAGTACLDLRITVTPMVVQGESFMVVSAEDISQAKRLEVLQRVFFHDVLNTAGCVSGYAYYLTHECEDASSVSNLIVRLSDQLIEEIKAQRDLLAAETGDLAVDSRPLPIRPVVEELRDQYLKSPVANERTIDLRTCGAAIVCTDRRLLMRILGNMLKNALEATSAGQTVTIDCIERDSEVAFAVHNPEIMPDEVRMQVFQRSFSTKGQGGRGIGTYSMKLLGERYLGGRVEFVSQAPAGTVFSLTLPKWRMPT